MKIFITGGTGGLGKILVNYLSEQGHELTILSRKPPSGAFGEKIQVEIGDLLNRDYGGCLQKHDAVIHLAGVTHTNNASEYYAVNTGGTGALASMAEQNGVSRFILVSSRAANKTCGAYGDSKVQAEELVKKTGLDWTIAKPGEIYGASGKEAVSRLISALDKFPFVPVPGRVQAKLAPVFVDDVVRALAAMLVEEKTIRKSYVLAGPEEMTYAQFVDEILKIKGQRKPKLSIPIWALRILALSFAVLKRRHPPLVKDQVQRLLCVKSADISPARADFGYNPRTLREVLLPRCEPQP